MRNSHVNEPLVFPIEAVHWVGMRRDARYRALLWSVGVCGWGLLLYRTATHGQSVLAWHSSVMWEWVGTLSIAAAVRCLPVRIFDRGYIVLDAACYVAATFVFGTLPATWMAVILATLDMIIRIAQNGPHVRRTAFGARLRWADTCAQVLFAGGVPACVLLGLGLMFASPPLHSGVHAAVTDLYLLWTVPLFATLFVILQYSIASLEHGILGAPIGRLVQGFLFRTVGAELLLMPLALAMVLGYAHQGHFLFLLLGATTVLFSAIYRRAAIATFRQHQRVQELSTLNKVGRIIAGSLERRMLMANIATETLRLVQHTSRFMIGILEPDRDTVLYQLFDETGRLYKEIEAPKSEGLSGWIMANRRPILLNDAQRQYGQYAPGNKYNDPRFHSWLGVPLISHDNVIGALSVQSEHRGAYTSHHLRVLDMIGDQAAVAVANARLYELATVDGLTGLNVRRFFDQRLREEWQRAIRHGHPLTVVLLDLDHFKTLNDTYGHQAGDRVLKAAATAVRASMRNFDVAARYGGEEFALVLPSTTAQEGVHMAERIRSDIARLRVDVHGQNVQITTSIGLAQGPLGDIALLDVLLGRADRALYTAKRRGRNCVVVADDLESERHHFAMPRQQDIFLHM